MTKRRYTKPGRRERAARKRQLRMWQATDGNVTVSAPFTYWIRYRAAELASGLRPLKLGRKHRERKLFRNLIVADNRKPPSPKVVTES